MTRYFQFNEATKSSGLSEVFNTLERISNHIKLKSFNKISKTTLKPLSKRRNFDNNISTKKNANVSVIRMKNRVAPRYTLNAQVIVNQNGKQIKCEAINISNSGVFIYTTKKALDLSDTVTITIKPRGKHEIYELLANVIRFNSNPKYAFGYGLQFIHGKEFLGRS